MTVQLASRFRFDDRPLHLLPSGILLVRGAHAAGDQRLVADVHATADGWAVIHPSDRVSLDDGSEAKVDDLTLKDTRRVRVQGDELCTLEQVLLEAHRLRMGLVIRLRDPSAIRSVAAAIEVTGGEGFATFRRRFLVVAPDQRIGRRLRQEAPEIPSGLQIEGGEKGVHGFLRRRLPNLARAGASADDLLVPHDLFDRAHLAEKLLPTLRSRGAGLWLTGVPPAEVPGFAELPLAGMLVERPFATD